MVLGKVMHSHSKRFHLGRVVHLCSSTSRCCCGYRVWQLQAGRGRSERAKWFVSWLNYTARNWRLRHGKPSLQQAGDRELPWECFLKGAGGEAAEDGFPRQILETKPCCGAAQTGLSLEAPSWANFGPLPANVGEELEFFITWGNSLAAQAGSYLIS